MLEEEVDFERVCAAGLPRNAAKSESVADDASSERSGSPDLWLWWLKASPQGETPTSYPARFIGTSLLPSPPSSSSSKRASNNSLGAAARAAASAIYWKQAAHARSVTVVVTEQTITLLAPGGTVVRDDLVTDLK